MVAQTGKSLQEAARRRSSTDAEPLESEEEFVTVRPFEGHCEDDSCMEVRISCPDATGLGCDVARMLFDFGLRLLEGDVSTDGQWCFLVFKVKLSRDVKAHWSLLQKRLKSICPQGGGALPLWSKPQAVEEYGPAFILSVSSYDRRGFLHDLMHMLWEADVLVFKAHITTSSEGKVLDMFWIHDHKLELPENHRVLQIKEMVKACVHQMEIDFRIEAAPLDEGTDEAASVLVKRCACVDASAFSPLRRLLSRRRKDATTGDVVITTQADEFGTPEQIQIGIDNCTTSAYSVVNVVCNDRKGLVYDLMRTLKDTHIRIAYGKIAVRLAGRCEVDLFVQEVDGSRITDTELQAELVERVRHAVTLPLRIEVKNPPEGRFTELLVTAFLDSGGRGRPRVTYDVTAALSSLDLCVFTADIYIDVLESDFDRPVEIHRFLVHKLGGRRLESAADKRQVYSRVKAQLMGTDELQQDVQLPPPKDTQVDIILDSLSAWNWKG